VVLDLDPDLITPTLLQLRLLGVEDADPVVGRHGGDLIEVLVGALEDPGRDCKLAFLGRHPALAEHRVDAGLDRLRYASRVSLVDLGPDLHAPAAVLGKEPHGHLLLVRGGSGVPT
jgi:hypothetical protein